MFSLRTPTHRVALGAVAVALSGCAGWNAADPDQPPYQPNLSTPAALVGVTQGEMFEATQNWTDRIRSDFWHIDQGSLTAPYDIARTIQRADSPLPFLSAESIVRYRYVPQNAGTANPDGLPLGFTKSQPWQGETYLGMTCSACHTSIITHRGKGVMMDGAPGQGDFQGFFKDLTAAFRAAMDQPAKFDALAVALDAATPADRTALRARLDKATKALEARRKLNRTESVYGYGRVDAIGQIFNAVASQNIGLPENRGDPNAPVNYPFLWGTHQSNVVQWNGFAPNVTKFNDVRLVGPLIRNAGEVLGVFGAIDIPKTGGAGTTYRNSTRQRNLLQVEEWLEDLTPPPWPEDILGPIDREKAARGAALYADARGAKCATCHQVMPDPLKCYNAVMTPLDKIGTDPGQALNSLRTAKTGRLEGRWARLSSSPDGKLGAEEPILKMLVHEVVWGTLKDVKGRPVSSAVNLASALFAERREEKCDTPFRPNKNFKAYKARPLNGVWATAPFLHNGSVPTLRALLDRPADRPKTFTLGGWEYDPVGVGFAPYTGPRPFTLDTTLKGNSNAGHDYGTDLSDADKDAIVEYLKTL